MTRGATLAGVHVYPLKSAAGIALPRARVERHGLALDRRWMLVDEEGVFLSQRVEPRLALLSVEIGEGRLTVRAPQLPDLDLALHPQGVADVPVRIWGDRTLALGSGDEADAWFGAWLGRRVRIVYVPDASLRQVDLGYARRGDRVGFADGFPFLLISQGSLDELNRRLDVPLPMHRFRPNLVVSGVAPFAEDEWVRIRIGEVVFHVVKPCARCSVTTVDQATGVPGVEPLRTLATFRRVGGKVVFGQNLVHDPGTDSEESVEVGATVVVEA